MGSTRSLPSSRAWTLSPQLQRDWRLPDFHSLIRAAAWGERCDGIEASCTLSTPGSSDAGPHPNAVQSCLGDIQGVRPALGPHKFRTHFSLCCRHLDSICPRHSRTKCGGARNWGEKHQISNPFGSRMTPVVKFVTNQHIFPYRTLTHMTDPMTCHTPQATSPSRSQVFSSLFTTWCDPQRSVPQGLNQPSRAAAVATRRKTLASPSHTQHQQPN